jgi:V8-like Glu-specific endopeptidase
VLVLALSGGCSEEGGEGGEQIAAAEAFPLLQLSQVAHPVAAPPPRFTDPSGKRWSLLASRVNYQTATQVPSPVAELIAGQFGEESVSPSQGVSLIFPDGRRYQRLDPVGRNPIGEHGGKIGPGGLLGPTAPIQGKILGGDARTERTNTSDYPNSAIAYVVTGAGSCSGALFEDDLLLTAAHCVHEGNTNTAYAVISVDPGRSESNAVPRPFTRSGELARVVPNQWINSGDWGHDWAIIHLDFSYQTTGWFGFADYSDGTLDPMALYTYGYPGDQSPFPSLWGMGCSVSRSQSQELYHDCDTFDGQSGSPVWVRTGGSRYIVGVHSGSCTNCNDNRSTRVNTSNDLFDEMVDARATW